MRTVNPPVAAPTSLRAWWPASGRTGVATLRDRWRRQTGRTAIAIRSAGGGDPGGRNP